jgi:hypothetical protein
MVVKQLIELAIKQIVVRQLEVEYIEQVVQQASELFDVQQPGIQSFQQLVPMECIQLFSFLIIHNQSLFLK